MPSTKQPSLKEATIIIIVIIMVRSITVSIVVSSFTIIKIVQTRSIVVGIIVALFYRQMQKHEVEVEDHLRGEEQKHEIIKDDEIIS